MRILLSEGSGLTSRQTAQRLGELGHDVELVSSSALCLSRFTRHVRAVHPISNFGIDPLGWLDAVIKIGKRRRVDLIFPTQEQVTILSAQAMRLPFATIVPPFAALRRMQDKISAYRTLAKIGVPQPHAIEVATAADLADVVAFPVFVKRPISTASLGVRLATTPDELAVAANELRLDGDGLIVQTKVLGPLAMVQAVANHGRVIAYHANLRVKEGVGGGAAIKESVTIPRLPDILERVVSSLEWHGALSLDMILSESGPVVIDVNPRLVEPANAFFSGVDHVGAMLELTASDKTQVQPVSRLGVRSHQSLLAILGTAAQTGSRRAILREAMDAFFLRGPYSRSKEELTPIAGDAIAAVPVLAALLATILRPELWRKFHAGTVGSYSLTAQGWRDILISAGF